MQVRKSSRNIGVWRAAVVIAVGLGVCGVSPVSAEDGAGNQVFFKAGYVGMNSNRGGETFAGAGNDSTSGWYAGAGLDLLLSKDVWGAMEKTSVLGEIGLQFNRLASKVTTNAGVSGATPVTTQLTMVTIDVAPKIKFMEGSAFRPWVIPIGLDIHVISPPSNQTQYLDMGVQFGGGFEYQVWKAFKVGLDARYHLTANMTNTTNSYFQVGPYVGISF